MNDGSEWDNKRTSPGQSSGVSGRQELTDKQKAFSGEIAGLLRSAASLNCMMNGHDDGMAFLALFHALASLAADAPPHIRTDLVEQVAEGFAEQVGRYVEAKKGSK